MSRTETFPTSMEKAAEGKALKRLILLSLAAGLAMFLPFLLQDGGRLSLISDFNFQQIPFNMHGNWALRNGQLGWDWYTDLGADFIGAYSFYTLGSPFFWLSALFPPEAYPYLIGWVYILKYVAASVFAFLWLKRQTGLDYAVLGAMLYAFSGFSHINLQFYHFHEVIAFFPLLLYALDRLVQERKRGLFALATALCALTNYFFFFGEVLFLMLYFFLVYPFASGKERRSAFFRVLGEGSLGVMAAGVLLLPSALFILYSPKTGSMLQLGDFFIYDQPLRYLSLLKAIFLPAEAMVWTSGPFLYDYSSSALYLPVLGMALALAGFKTSPYRRLILLLAVMALVPILNASFTLFNSMYYARWFYLPLLILSAMSAQALEKLSSEQCQSALLITAALTLALFLLIFSLDELNLVGFATLKLARSVAMALAGLMAAYFIFLRWREDFQRPLLALITLFAVITGSYTLFLTRSADAEETRAFARGYLEETATFPLQPSAGENTQNYRFYTAQPAWNLSLLNHIPSANSFITTNSPSTYEFFKAVGIRHIPTSIFPEEVHDILTFLSVRYRLDSSEYEGYDQLYVKNNGNEDIHVSENPDFIPLGFPLDYYLTKAQLMAFPQKERAHALLQAMVIADGAAPPANLKAYTKEAHSLSTEAIVQGKEGRLVTDFKRDAGGFSGKISADHETTLLFSVPADQGWRAQLDGQPQEFRKSLGFLTLQVPPGTHEFSFSYETPGLKIGFILSFLGFGQIFRLLVKRNPPRQSRPGLRIRPGLNQAW